MVGVLFGGASVAGSFGTADSCRFVQDAAEFFSIYGEEASMNLSKETALRMISAAEEKANELGVPMVIAVVDRGGNLIAQVRQDDALLASIDLALNKAYTAVAVKVSTETLGELAQPGQSLYGIQTDKNGRFVIFGGGLPVTHDDVIIGGIGVSGGSVEQDIACADAGLSAFC